MNATTQIASKIIATNCVCCGRTLTDETSISWGMGPVCRKHGAMDRDINADWGKALAALGPSCPADIYNAVVDACGVRKGHDEKEIDTVLSDTVPAVRAIVHALAVAMVVRESKEAVCRMIAALSKLGHVRLARHLVKSFMRRVEFRSAYAMLCVDVAHRDGHTDASTKYDVRITYDYKLLSAVRGFAAQTRYFDRKTRTWHIDGAQPQAMAESFAKACPDLVAGPKGVTTKFNRPVPTPARAWWTEGREEDRACWVDSETGSLVRYAIQGEPAWLPGLEKVPAEFFGHSYTPGAAASLAAYGAEVSAAAE